MENTASAEVEELSEGRTRTLAERLRDQLEEMIINGTLQPGTRVDEAELAQQFKMSRTPVREALRALSATGLLANRPRQGVYVAAISIPVLLQMFEMMATLEGLCAKLAARRATTEQKRALREIHRRLTKALQDGDAPTFYLINQEFHDLLYDASQAQFIASQTRALRKRVAAYRKLVTYRPGRMVATIGEHDRIITAIEKGDAEGAFRAASEHVTLLGDDMADFIAALPPSLTQAP